MVAAARPKADDSGNARSDAIDGSSDSLAIVSGRRVRGELPAANKSEPSPTWPGSLFGAFPAFPGLTTTPAPVGGHSRSFHVSRRHYTADVLIRFCGSWENVRT